MKKIVKYTLLLIMLVPIVAILAFIFSDPSVKYEIPQKIGGSLVVEGIEWMDIQSFGDIVKLKYKRNNEDEFYIGESDYYGRQFEKTKQIIKLGEYYLLSVGDRLKGDKVYASVDLKKWKEFTFNRELILKIDKDKQLYLENYYPDKVFVKDLKESTAVWERRTNATDTTPRKLLFSFKVDWKNSKLVYSK